MGQAYFQNKFKTNQMADAKLFQRQLQQRFRNRRLRDSADHLDLVRIARGTRRRLDDRQAVHFVGDHFAGGVKQRIVRRDRMNVRLAGHDKADRHRRSGGVAQRDPQQILAGHDAGQTAVRIADEQRAYILQKQRDDRVSYGRGFGDDDRRGLIVPHLHPLQSLR
jgi:hypothetical protein